MKLCLFLFYFLSLPLAAFELVIVAAQDDTKYRTLQARIVRIATDSTSVPNRNLTLNPNLNQPVRLVRVVVHGSKDMEKAWEPLVWYVAPLGQPVSVTVPHLYSSTGFYRARAEWWTP